MSFRRVTCAIGEAALVRYFGYPASRHLTDNVHAPPSASDNRCSPHPPLSGSSHISFENHDGVTYRWSSWKARSLTVASRMKIATTLRHIRGTRALQDSHLLRTAIGRCKSVTVSCAIRKRSHPVMYVAPRLRSPTTNLSNVGIGLQVLFGDAIMKITGRFSSKAIWPSDLDFLIRISSTSLNWRQYTCCERGSAASGVTDITLFSNRRLPCSVR